MAGFLGKLKQWITGEPEQKPAPTPSADYYRTQAQTPKPAPAKAQSWPGVGAPTAAEKAVGAKPLNPSTWTPTPSGQDKYGVPKAVTSAMPPAIASALKEGPPKPSAAEYQILKSAGWQMPDDAEPSVQVSAFDTEDPRTLVSYSYMPENEEIERLAEIYKGMPGYVPPSEAKAGKVDINEYYRRGQIAYPQLSTKTTDAITSQMESAALTWEAYDKLSDDQRAAVDFNTLLVEAREKDLGISYAKDPYTGEQKAEYDKTVESMFGEKGGSEKFAPNTVALLKQIDFTAVGQDLDEYLSLERAFTASEVKNFKIKDLPELKQLGDGVDYKAARTVENRAALDATTVQKSAAAIKTAMLDASKIREDFVSTMLADVSNAATAWGGQAMDLGEAAPGFPFIRDQSNPYIQGNEADEKAMFFNTAYNAASAGDMDTVWENIKIAGLDDKDVQELFNYLDTRSKQEGRWGKPAGAFTEPTPEE